MTSETLPVYAGMTTDKEPIRMLMRGDSVVIGLVLFGDEITWCAVTRPGETKRLGFVSCEPLEREREGPAPAAPSQPGAPPQSPAASATAEPAKPRDPPKVTVREVPLSSLKVREVAPPPVVREVARAELKPEGPPIPAPAPPEAPSGAGSQDFVWALLSQTGVEAGIAQFVRSSLLLSFLDKTRLAAIDQSALRAAVSEHFRAELFSQSIADQFKRSYAPEPYAALPPWVASPAAQRMGALAARAASAEAHKEISEFAAALKNDPPSQERLVLLHRLYDAVKLCEIEVETTMAVVRAIAAAINPVLPAAKRFGEGDLDTALAAVRPQYQAVMKNARLVQYLFAFREVDDAQLEEYVKFWESETGVWVTVIFDKGFRQATETVSRNLVRDIPARLAVRAR
ncbi:MAG: hypothetical protein ACRD8O_12185 [Bryobacteraceae bacterium]